ncbi:MAG: hypothetical protein H3C55_14485 [Pseudorhodoplanes sp.]|nr:hypothetical protein [Pseudorhodoplanes sp.]MBW7950540.1 hypothetical protein [Pseudorhodoplanes sp.]GIK82579.1 MAG: hypothetical protein BroJett024_36840 [Alphaproteobacteria bacterium]
MTSPQQRLASTVSVAGIVIRYAFYLFGALAFGLVALGMLAIWNSRAKRVDAQPAFRMTAPELSRLPQRSQIVTGGRLGRVEIRQHGRIFHRDVDFTIALIMHPADSIALTSDGLPRLPNVKPLRSARTVASAVHYDLDTRLGDYRANELRVDADGQWKQCLAFVSRFDTDAVSIAGWYCDASGARPSADRLACLLDRMALEAPLHAKEADAFLRERLAQAPKCAAAPVAQTTDTRTRTRTSPQQWSVPSARRAY